MGAPTAAVRQTMIPSVAPVPDAPERQMLLGGVAIRNTGDRFRLRHKDAIARRKSRKEAMDLSLLRIAEFRGTGVAETVTKLRKEGEEPEILVPF